MTSIPSPGDPAFFQMAQWILNPVGYMQRNFGKYGDIFHAQIMWDTENPSFVFVNEPKALQYILTHDTGQEFSAPGEVNRLLEPMLGRQNLILLSGRQHRQRRQLVMPPFHGDRLKAYGQLIQNITQEVLDAVPVDQPFNLRPMMQNITMRIILEAVFGLHQGDRFEQINRLLSRRLEMTSTPLTSIILFFPWLQKDYGTWSLGGYIRRLAGETDRLLFEEIQERRANPAPDRIDVLSLLLAARDEEGKGLTDQDLRDELMTLLVAGHETTATALTWALYWVHSRPDVWQTLLSEIDTLPQSCDPNEFLQLPYLGAVCNETLRLHPVAMLTFPRQAEVPLELCGYSVEPGALLMGCIYLIHQRTDLYPQPGLFRPERFLERQFSPYEFLPFGGGIRRCVGSALAQAELKIVLGTVLSRYCFSLANQRPVKPGRRGVTLGQKSPVILQKVGMRSDKPNLIPV